MNQKKYSIIPKTAKIKSRKGSLPDVFREAIFDEFFIFVLIKTHKDGVVTGFGSGFEVEHHFFLVFSERKDIKR